MRSITQILFIISVLFILPTTIAQKPRARRVSVGKSSALVLHLPIEIKTPRDHLEPQPSENENQPRGNYHPFQGKQRLVMRAYNPDDDDGEEEEREPSSDENNESRESRNDDYDGPNDYPNVGFLRWNSGNRGMTLNIKDYFDLGAGGPSSTSEEDEAEEEEEEEPNEEPEHWPEQKSKRLKYSSVNYSPPPSARYSSGKNRNFKPGNFFQDPESFGFAEEDEEEDMPPPEFSSPRSKKSGYEHGSGNFEGLSGGIYGSHPVMHFLRENSDSAKKQRRKNQFRGHIDALPHNKHSWW